MIYLALALWPYLLASLLIGAATGYFARRDDLGGRP